MNNKVAVVSEATPTDKAKANTPTNLDEKQDNLKTCCQYNEPIPEVVAVASLPIAGIKGNMHNLIYLSCNLNVIR